MLAKAVKQLHLVVMRNKTKVEIISNILLTEFTFAKNCRFQQIIQEVMVDVKKVPRRNHYCIEAEAFNMRSIKI